MAKYSFRALEDCNNDILDEVDAEDAASTVGANSSPVRPLRANWRDQDLAEEPLPALLYHALPESEDEQDDPTFRAPPQSDDIKCRQTLQYMRDNFSRFSLRAFLETLFTSQDPYIKQAAGVFLYNSGAVLLAQLLWACSRHLQPAKYNPAFSLWVTERAGEVVEQEFSWLTNRASDGPHYEDAQFLRVHSERVTVSMAQNFELAKLTSLYLRTTPHLQWILQAAIGKQDDMDKENTLGCSEATRKEVEGAGAGTGKPIGRDPVNVCTTVTSMLLNIRSRKTNYHAVINGLVCWEQRVSKRFVEALNHSAYASSYEFINHAVPYLSNDSTRTCCRIASDRSLVKMLPYDNFNWRQRAWEVSAQHSTVQHDQVSAMLINLHIPPSLRSYPPSDLTSVARFAERIDRRHSIPPEISLEHILPDASDEKAFRDAAIKHVAFILTQDTSFFKQFQKSVQPFTDPHAILPHKTERHFLPTLDQEQTTTRGNMEVLSRYFLDILKLPKTAFENEMFFVPGDRLTTARDRAAQDQRAVDRSQWRMDHLSSFALAGGLMHYCLNMIRCIAANSMGSSGKADPVSLGTLRDLLPNRGEVNARKIDFYAWLRFLDVVLRLLVVAASYAHLQTDSVTEAQAKTACFEEDTFWHHCTHLVDTYLLPSRDRSEADGVKTVPGFTVSSNATTLMHELMTLREMRHSIKHGHPTRIHYMLKYWMPMYYGGGGYNYSHETMELLHNLQHDWPPETAQVLLAGMLVNTTGRPDGFKESDLDVEHLNEIIKAHAHGTNASPDLLKNITPALGEAKALTDRLFKDLGVDAVYQRHRHVRQGKDVAILSTHLIHNHVFRYDQDAPTPHHPKDLFRDGRRRVSGHKGGHMKHLHRHKLRLRTRHGGENPTASTIGQTHPRLDTSQDGGGLDTEDGMESEIAMWNDLEYTLMDSIDDLIGPED